MQLAEVFIVDDKGTDYHRCRERLESAHHNMIWLHEIFGLICKLLLILWKVHLVKDLNPEDESVFFESSRDEKYKVADDDTEKKQDF